MNREQNAKQFMRIVMSQRDDDEEDDDIDISINEFDLQKMPHLEKKETNFVAFLNKFTYEDIRKIDDYVEKHKNLLQLTPLKKISLFEDALILREFLKVRDKLKRERVKTVENVAEMLQIKMRRSKITIKQRIRKKLPHLRVEDILKGIEENKAFDFNKKAKT